MGDKRREDEHFKVGESMPGTKGDSEGTGDADSPMENIHNRRDGELLSKEETEEYLDDTDPSEIHPNHDPKELTEEEKKEKIAAKYESRYSQYWPDDDSDDSSE